MGSPSARAVAYAVAVPFDDDGLDVLRQRVSAEFHEMPGLLLTLSQAARLFSVDAARCERVLHTLVDHGVLVSDGRAFSLADAGLAAPGRADLDASSGTHAAPTSRANCPVHPGTFPWWIATRGSSEDDVIKRIVVPMDFSPPAEAALPIAARLAPAVGGTICLVHVVENAASPNTSCVTLRARF